MNLKFPDYAARPQAQRVLVGVDLFFRYPTGSSPAALAEQLNRLGVNGAKLEMINNRGTKVWPDGFSETFCTDHWVARFRADGTTFSPTHIVGLLQKSIEARLEVIKMENLYTFDGAEAFAFGRSS